MNTLAADFTELAKEYTLPNQKISIWDQFLTGQSQYYEGLTQQTQDVASYDISEAYSNYKKQQLQLQMNEQLGSGFKQQIGSELQSAYDKTYQDIRTQEESALASVASKYAEARLESEEQIAEYGQYAKDISNIFDQFAQYEMGINFEDIDVNGQTVDPLITPIEQGGLGWYTQSVDEYGNITYDLTDYGREHYQELLFSPTYARKFEKYFEEENPELFEEFKKNQDFYQQIIGGLEYGRRTYDKELSPRLQENERQSAIKTVADAAKQHTGDLSAVYGDYQSLSTEQARSLTELLKRDSRLVSTMTEQNVGDMQDNFGLSWKRGQGTIDYEQVGTSVGGKNLGKEIGLIDANGNVIKSNLRKGDIIEHNGKYYHITDIVASNGWRHPGRLEVREVIRK